MDNKLVFTTKLDSDGDYSGFDFSDLDKSLSDKDKDTINQIANQFYSSFDLKLNKMITLSIGNVIIEGEIHPTINRRKLVKGFIKILPNPKKTNLPTVSKQEPDRTNKKIIQEKPLLADSLSIDNKEGGETDNILPKKEGNFTAEEKINIEKEETEQVETSLSDSALSDNEKERNNDSGLPEQIKIPTIEVFTDSELNKIVIGFLNELNNKANSKIKSKIQKSIEEINSSKLGPDLIEDLVNAIKKAVLKNKGSKKKPSLTILVKPKKLPSDGLKLRIELPNFTLKIKIKSNGLAHNDL